MIRCPRNEADYSALSWKVRWASGGLARLRSPGTSVPLVSMVMSSDPALGDSRFCWMCVCVCVCVCVCEGGKA